MPQITIANTQCTLLAGICDAAANGNIKTETKVELVGLADMLRKANGTYEARPDGPPMGAVQR